MPPRASSGGPRAPQIDKLRLFYNHPGFIEAVSDRVWDALEQIPAERRGAARLIYTAHSIPVAAACNCSYEQQLAEACRLVSQRLGRAEWHVAYQSRSGSPRQVWLEPQVRDMLQALAEQNPPRDVVVAPIGFVCRHMEVVYDLDVEVRRGVRAIGDESGACRRGGHASAIRAHDPRVGPGADRGRTGAAGLGDAWARADRSRAFATLVAGGRPRFAAFPSTLFTGRPYLRLVRRTQPIAHAVFDHAAQIGQGGVGVDVAGSPAADRFGRFSGGRAADFPGVHVRPQRFDHLDQLGRLSEGVDFNPSGDSCRMGLAECLGPPGDGRAAGLPLLAQLFRPKTDLRGVFPAIARDVKILRAPHATYRHHLHAKVVLLQDKKRISRQPGCLVRLIGVGGRANKDLALIARQFLCIAFEFKENILSRPRRWSMFRTSCGESKRRAIPTADGTAGIEVES